MKDSQSFSHCNADSLQNLSSICTFKCRLDTAVCNCIFGPKLSMIRIIIYTCTKESTRLHVLQHSNKVILWRSAASSGPQGQNWWQRPEPSLWLQLKALGLHGEQAKKNNKFSVGHSLRIIHIQAICSSTCDGILSWVPCEMDQLCWEVKRISIGINTLVFSTCSIIVKWWLGEHNNLVEILELMLKRTSHLSEHHG